MDELIAKNPRLLKEYREKVAKKRYLKRKGKKEDQRTHKRAFYRQMYKKQYYNFTLVLSANL